MEKFDWTKQKVAQLRRLSKKHTDIEIAQKMGLSRGYITLSRKKFGIPSFKTKGQTPFEWTDDLIDQFNALPNDITLKDASQRLGIPIHIVRPKLEERRGKVYNRLKGDKLAEFCACAEMLTNKELADRFEYSEQQISIFRKKYGVKRVIPRKYDEDTVRAIRLYEGTCNAFRCDYGVDISASMYYNIKAGISYKDVI